MVIKVFNLDVWQYLILGYGVLALIWLLTVFAFYEILKRVNNNRKSQLTYESANHYFKKARKIYQKLNQQHKQNRNNK